MIQQKVKSSAVTKLRLDRISRMNPMQIYCWATVACVLIEVFTFFASHGELLHKYFFFDTRDTGMDFFYSIQYVNGRMPYGQFNTLYPPLANLFFYVLYLFVPKEVSNQWGMSFLEAAQLRGTERDVRLKQSTMIMFMVFVIVSVLCIEAMSRKMLENSESRYKSKVVVSFLLSYGVVYALERGNIILICWILIALFVVYRKSENALVRELSYIALAIAAGMKLYPAFFGVLLLRDKEYTAAARTVVYGLAAFIWPLFIFNEGICGITMWLRTLLDFTGSKGYPWVGNGMSSIMSEAGHFLDCILGTNLADNNYFLSGVIVAVVLLVSAFSIDKEWKRVLTLVVAIILFQAQYDYVYSLVVIPLCLFFAQEKEIDRNNLFPFMLMLMLTLPLPLYHDGTYDPTFVARNTLYHIVLVLLVIWSVVEAAAGAHLKCPARKTKPITQRQLAFTLGVLAALVIGSMAGWQVWEKSHNWGFDFAYNGCVGTDGVMLADVQCSDGETVNVRWSGRGAYLIVYNHAPFEQEMTLSFETGYGMDLHSAHTMTFFVESTEGIYKTRRENLKKVKVEREDQTVQYTFVAEPGQTQINVSYDGPMAVYDASSRKKGTFSVANLAVTSEGVAEKTE